MTKLERAQLRAAECRSHFDEGYRRGRLQAEQNTKDDIKVKQQEAKIKLAQQLGQMIEATARAVITFVGEGGLQ